MLTLVLCLRSVASRQWKVMCCTPCKALRKEQLTSSSTSLICFYLIFSDVVVKMRVLLYFRWRILQAVTADSDNKDTPVERVTELSVKFLQKRMVAKVPCTRLRISGDGQYLAVGCSDGSVTVWSTSSLSQVQRFAHHDLPVTGLSFAPHRVLASERGERTLALLASCSADNKMVVMHLRSKYYPTPTVHTHSFVFSVSVSHAPSLHLALLVVPVVEGSLLQSILLAIVVIAILSVLAIFSFDISQLLRVY